LRDIEGGVVPGLSGSIESAWAGGVGWLGHVKGTGASDVHGWLGYGPCVSFIPAWPRCIEDAWLRDLPGRSRCADGCCAGLVQDWLRDIEKTGVSDAHGWLGYVEGGVCGGIVS
jgi:hypothetical protein